MIGPRGFQDTIFGQEQYRADNSENFQSKTAHFRSPFAQRKSVLLILSGIGKREIQLRYNPTWDYCMGSWEISLAMPI